MVAGTLENKSSLGGGLGLYVIVLCVNIAVYPVLVQAGTLLLPATVKPQSGWKGKLTLHRQYREADVLTKVSFFP